MKVELFRERGHGSNVYRLLFGKEALFVDAGRSASDLVFDQMSIRGVLCTHGHFDHILHVDAMAEEFQVPIFACEKEIPMFTDSQKNASFLINTSLRINTKIIGLDSEQVLLPSFFSFSNTFDCTWTITVLHTPGHTDGSVCYFYEDQSGEPPILFSGDTVFKGSVGRTDIGGNIDELHSSIEKISRLPPETIIYPGHGPSTTLAQEKSMNPYF